MINTVLGEVNTKNFDNVLLHEHIGCISNDLMRTFGQKWVDKEKLSYFAAEIYKGLNKKHDVGLIVDGTPIDLGRDVSLIKKVSEMSNIPIVVSTGLYHYPSMYTAGHTEFEIASWFIKEFEFGIQTTNIKPSMLKVASDVDGITKDNKKRLVAMSIAQKETGLPIYVHSNHMSDFAQRQLEILLGNIREPDKIVIGHAALNPDVEYLKRILDKGCCICMDQCHCTNYSIDSIGKTLAALCQDGYTSQILLSNDLCIYTDFGTRKNTGLQLSVEQQIQNFSHIFTVVYNSFLENGGRASDWDTMFKKNPIRILDI